ncbi:hypothetical protein QQP08_014889 [Theobroma cacao]|nr:hypothetical protein QQP08_014889 [Theobroma cacao]
MRTNVKLQVSNKTWQVKMANHPEYARLLSSWRKFSLLEEDVCLNLSGYHLQKQRQRGHSLRRNQQMVLIYATFFASVIKPQEINPHSPPLHP